ncbi:hypothetical protein [Paraburkholderia sp. GAS199]|uniref:hypothetical protein n=1 Tax=Paraburkholderia sp. GAS199 TaxID=3035126 RepID=UPI003D1A02B5
MLQIPEDRNAGSAQGVGLERRVPNRVFAGCWFAVCAGSTFTHENVRAAVIDMALPKQNAPDRRTPLHDRRGPNVEVLLALRRQRVVTFERLQRLHHSLQFKDDCLLGPKRIGYELPLLSRVFEVLRNRQQRPRHDDDKADDPEWND